MFSTADIENNNSHLLQLSLSTRQFSDEAFGIQWFFAPLSLISNQSENDYIRTANQVQNQTKFICSLRDVSRAFQRLQLVVALVVAMHTDQKPLCYLILYKPMFFL